MKNKRVSRCMIQSLEMVIQKGSHPVNSTRDAVVPFYGPRSPGMFQSAIPVHVFAIKLISYPSALASYRYLESNRAAVEKSRMRRALRYSKVCRCIIKFFNND